MYELQARTGAPAAWLLADHPGAPAYGPFLLPDGRDADELIADGNVADLGFTPRFVLARGYRLDDLVWTTQRVKIASARFVAALEPFTGWRAFPIDASDRKGAPLAGLVGFAVCGTQGRDGVWNEYPWQGFSFLVNDEVQEHLRRDGVTALRTARRRPRSEERGLHSTG